MHCKQRVHLRSYALRSTQISLIVKSKYNETTKVTPIPVVIKYIKIFMILKPIVPTYHIWLPKQENYFLYMNNVPRDTNSGAKPSLGIKI